MNFSLLIYMYFIRMSYSGRFCSGDISMAKSFESKQNAQLFLLKAEGRAISVLIVLMTIMQVFFCVSISINRVCDELFSQKAIDKTNVSYMMQ